MQGWRTVCLRGPSPAASRRDECFGAGLNKQTPGPESRGGLGWPRGLRTTLASARQRVRSPRLPHRAAAEFPLQEYS